jgi:hypothetical protein
MFKPFRTGAGAAATTMLAASVAFAAEPTAFSCQFDGGTAHAYDKGRFSSEPTGAFGFDITAIDRSAQTATWSNARGATGTLRTVLAVDALSLIEVVAAGHLNITTIYDRDTASGKHPAVHSRHTSVIGQPVVSHAVGMCEAKRVP